MGKLSILTTLVLVLSTSVLSQEHYLISPDEEVVRLEPGSDASSFISEIRNLDRNAAPDVCPGDEVVIIDPPLLNVLFNARHKDVMAQWYVAPTSGTIDTIFFTTGQIGDWLADSTVYVRVHRSNINPQYGPGIRPGPFNPPCQQWGYWVNTNDLDNGITGFPELATDTAWISTYPGPGISSTPPIGENMWGAGGGFPVRLNPGRLNMAVMANLAPLEVSLGDVFFISVELSSDIPGLPLEEIPTQFYASEWTVSTADYDYPSRNWKFYEHDKGPSVCSSLPIDSIKRGWIARGSTSGDSLDVLQWDMWYTITPAGNLPPIVVDYSHLGNTFSSADRVLQAVIDDCWPGNPSEAGVASATIVYEVDGGGQSAVAMSYVGADVWEGTIPGQPPGSRVTARVEAVDFGGLTGFGPSLSYSVVPFGNEWYALDTGYACSPTGISLTGTSIAAGELFLPPTASPYASAGNDGTAGPFDMGGDFYLFGDRFRYAWIGVNGGIALSKSETDTQDVNANGSFPGTFGLSGNLWDFPFPQKHTREIPSPEYMPGMFIAPFWADHILKSDSQTYGRILYGNGGDTCLFIVEWDSIGNNSFGAPQVDGTTFRVVLNRCTGTVEFQYDRTGVRDYTPGWNTPVTPALVGMQADSNEISGPMPGYVMLNRDGYPLETRPSDGLCIRMYPNIAGPVWDGWNMIAVSAEPLDGDYSVGSLFPELIGSAWFFDNGFNRADSLFPGRGYWAKFSGTGWVGTSPSTFIHSLNVPVKDKWNIIGGPSCAVPTGSLVAGGGTSLTSSFFGYGLAGYSVAGTIHPWHGYWVKVSGAGTLNMSCSDIPAAAPATAIPQSAPLVSGVIERANRITIRDAAGRSQTLYLAGTASEGRNSLSSELFELPPIPPGKVFDARFTSGRILEEINAVGVATPVRTLPIAVRGAAFPLEVEWKINPSPDDATLTLLSGAETDASPGLPMEGTGSAVFDALPSGLLAIRIGNTSALPLEYALGRNFPNPFNPSTVLPFTVERADRVVIRIYDVLGRSVRTLVDETREPGRYNAEWDGRDDPGLPVPSGVYIVRMTTGRFSASMKILLMK